MAYGLYVAPKANVNFNLYMANPVCRSTLVRTCEAKIFKFE